MMVSCNLSTSKKNTEKKVITELVEISLPVDGMTCSGCENTVNTQLLKLDGVTEAKASHIKKQVIIQVDTLVTSIAEVEDEIEKVGYKIIK